VIVLVFVISIITAYYILLSMDNISILVIRVCGILKRVWVFSLYYFIFIVGLIFLGSNIFGVLLGGSYTIIYGLVGIIGLVIWSVSICLTLRQTGFTSFFGHFTLSGIGSVMALFLPRIELFRIIIRPLTLSVRLATNITSGHVMILILALFRSTSILGVVVLFLLLLVSFIEVIVGMLQAFIFSILIVTYRE